MRKNNMLRIASVLLVAVLLTTCAISGVFAHYVTTGTAADDDATVAKWGVTVSSDISGLFASSYASEDDNLITLNIANSVNAADDVVAPGTEGKILDAITITGTPDVAVKIEYIAEVKAENWIVDGQFYCPLTIAGVNGLDYVSGADKTYTTASDAQDAFEAAVVAAIEGEVLYLEPNTNLATVDDVPNVPVTWAWSFTGDNVKDTALGDAAVNGTAASIYVSVNATVTQLN